MGDSTYVDTVTGEEFDINAPVTEETSLHTVNNGGGTQWIASSRKNILVLGLCVVITFAGVLLLCIDIRHSGKGGRHGK